MILAPFELHRPTSLDEAISLVAELGDTADIIAGGTDLLQNYKNRLNIREHLIALDEVPEMHGVTATRIGAMERLGSLSANPIVLETWPGLAEAITHVASPLIRNTGTIGGNLLVETRCYYFNQTPFWRGTKGSCLKAESDECLVIPQKETCYAAYSGDLAPLLGCLEGVLELASPRGRREVKVSEFYEGDGIHKNVLEKGELIVGVRIPESSNTLRAGYRKLRLRDALDYPEAGVAAAMRLDGGIVTELRAATTAVDVVPHFEDFTEACRGRTVADVAEEVADAMHKRAAPKKNTALPVGYRKKMVRVFLLRLLEDLEAGRSEGRIAGA
ncbi:FAD binding domain-containing protein [bacterium]|nr:FAD binding domain-containing protein [bacterium]